MKPQIKIDDKLRKKLDDFFKAGAPCSYLVEALPFAKIKVDDKTGKVYLVGLETASCDISFSTGLGKGEQMEEALSIKNTMLAEDAIKAAMKDYEAKKAKFS